MHDLGRDEDGSGHGGRLAAPKAEASENGSAKPDGDAPSQTPDMDEILF